MARTARQVPDALARVVARYDDVLIAWPAGDVVVDLSRAEPADAGIVAVDLAQADPIAAGAVRSWAAGHHSPDRSGR